MSIESEEKEKEEIWKPKKAVTSRRGSRKVQKSVDDDMAQNEPTRNRRSSRRLKPKTPYEENYIDEEMVLDSLVSIEGPMENGFEFSPADEVTDYRYSLVEH